MLRVLSPVPVRPVPTPPGDDVIPARRTDGSIIGDSLPGAGLWSFEATDEAATVKKLDTDYLAFGYWLAKNPNGTPVGFSVYYGGAEVAVAAAADVLTLDEKVTYNGAAAGKYVIKDDLDNTARPGYFTAAAEFSADLRNAITGIEDTTVGNTQIDTVAGTVAGMLTGTISDFKDGDDAPVGDLSLKLSGVLWHNGTNLIVRTDKYFDHDNTDATPLRGTNGILGKASGAAANVAGWWEAELYGSEKNTNIPTSVAGAFGANIGNGQAVVVGGFGATK